MLGLVQREWLQHNLVVLATFYQAKLLVRAQFPSFCFLHAIDGKQRPPACVMPFPLALFSSSVCCKGVPRPLSMVVPLLGTKANQDVECLIDWRWVSPPRRWKGWRHGARSVPCRVHSGPSAARGSKRSTCPRTQPPQKYWLDWKKGVAFVGAFWSPS